MEPAGDSRSGFWLLSLRFLTLFLGFLTMAWGIVMTINAGLGVSCFNVLHLGLSYHLPITVGQAAQVVGLLIIILAVFLGIRPRVGTWLNMLLVGAFIDLVIWSGLVPVPQLWPWRTALLTGGLAVMTLGMCLYMCAGLGAGPRDGLMLGLTLRFHSRVGVVRWFLETAAMSIGWLLGGPVGLGTLFSAVTLGWFLEGWFAVLLWLSRTVPGLAFLQIPPAFLERLARRGAPVELGLAASTAREP